MAKYLVKAPTIKQIVKYLTILISVGGLAWGIVAFVVEFRFETRRHFLEYQLDIFKKTSRTAAIIATSPDENEILDAKRQFLALIWGELGLVQTETLEAHLSNFESEFKKEIPKNLKTLAFCLTNEMGKTLADSWDVIDWKYTREGLEKSC